MLEYIMLSRALHGSMTAGADASSAKSTARTAQGATERLEMRLATLELTLETLLRMMMKSGTFSEEEFLRTLQAVDAEDGQIDGKRDMYKMRRQCPKCRKFSSGDRPRCMWCGENIQSIKPARLD